MDEQAAMERASRSDPYQQIVDYAQFSVLALLGILIVGSALVTVMCILGVIPWLTIPASLGGYDVPWLGPVVQIMFTLFCASLLAFLPATSRILSLEKAHRDFNLTLQDIEEAYRAAHAADRTGAFKLSEQFEAMKERLNYLRKHPDLGHLEPEILEYAAQMSYLSRDLATVYSDEAVARAHSFLAQRQQDVETHQENIQIALQTARDLKRWLDDVEAEERLAQLQIERLEGDLEEILPRIGYAMEPSSAQVLRMQRPNGSKRDRQALGGEPAKVVDRSLN